MKNKPSRSKHLERYVDGENVKFLNKRFIKDGYMYLLRGAKNGQDTGFYSQLYSEGKTIESEKLDPKKVASAQRIIGNTPFISATTDIYVAAGFANNNRIYVLKIPVEDVYSFCEDNTFLSLEESEYVIPDFISQEEIDRSFRYDKFKGIYHYLANEVGLDITPEDLGEYEDLNQPNMNKIKSLQMFNNKDSFLDPALKEVQKYLLSMKISKEKVKITDSRQKNACKRKIAMFTDAHGLLEPVQAILDDIKQRGITEVYSLGDNIGLGPNSGEVLDLLEENNVKSIKGNYEDTLDFGVEPFCSYLSEEKKKHFAWLKNALTQHQIDNVKLYPHFINLPFAGKNIALVHFANDVRCDFTAHSSLSYKMMLEGGMNASEQFKYTNSKEQLIELAAALKYDISEELLRRSSSDILKVLRIYVRLHQSMFKDYQKGIVSYIEEPLFTHDGALYSIDDYDAIFQGHVHFDLKDHFKNTDIYTLRAAGMGYQSDREKDQASYVILEEDEENKLVVKKVEVPFDREKMCYAINHAEVPSQDIKKYTLS